MFSSSLCRVGRSGLAVTRPITTSCAHTCPNTVAAPSRRPLSCRSHQRRHSSSKPSSPSDGSRGIAAQQANPTATSTSAAAEKPEVEKRSTARAGRRKAKDNVTAVAGVKGKDDTMLNLPSVPSTNHVHPADVAVSAFFSLHRPISVTSSVPPTSTPTSFDSIFTPRIRSLRPAQVIATLSNTVDSLEAATQTQQQSSSYEDATESDLRAAVTSVSVSNTPDSSSTRHLDSPPNNSPLQFPNHLLSSKYKPFTPPSPPSPFTSLPSTAETPSSSDQVLRSDVLPSTTLKKSYSTILTILESTHPNGSKTYTARTSPIVAEDPSAPSAHQNPRARFLHRMRDRQLRWEDYRRARLVGQAPSEQPAEKAESEAQPENEGEGYWAISVKRQRKLKMKKHKYKKLMRKTRNLRRRLERG